MATQIKVLKQVSATVRISKVPSYGIIVESLNGTRWREINGEAYTNLKDAENAAAKHILDEITNRVIRK